MNLFGCKFCDPDTGVCDRKNFDSLLWATVTVFQVGHHLIMPHKYQIYLLILYHSINAILICLDRFWLKRTGTSSCLRAWSGPATGQLSTLSLWWLSGTTSSSTCWSPSWWRASPTRYRPSPDCVPPTLYSYWTRSVHNNELSMAWNLCSISIYFVTSLLGLSI